MHLCLRQMPEVCWSRFALLSQAAMYFYPHNKHNVNFGCLLLVWICKKPITLSYTYDAIQYYMIRTSMLDNMFTRGRQFKEPHCWWKSNRVCKTFQSRNTHFFGFSDRCSIVSAKVKMGLSQQVCHIRQRIFFFQFWRKITQTIHQWSEIVVTESHCGLSCDLKYWVLNWLSTALFHAKQ